MVSCSYADDFNHVGASWLKSSASEQDTISWLSVTSPVTSSSAKLASPSTTATSVTPESAAPAATASGDKEMVHVAVRGATSMAAFMLRASSQTATTAEKGAPSGLRMSRSVNFTERGRPPTSNPALVASSTESDPYVSENVSS